MAYGLSQFAGKIQSSIRAMIRFLHKMQFYFTFNDFAIYNIKFLYICF